MLARHGATGMRSVNVEPSPSDDCTSDLASVVGGHVAHDGQPEPGAARLAAAGPVDAVEALEDPVEVAGRDADARVGDDAVDDTVRRRCVDTHDLAARLAVLHRVVDQVAERRHELAAVAQDDDLVGGLVEIDPDVALLGRGQRARPRVTHQRADVDGLANGLAAELDARQLEQIVDRRRRAVRLVDHLAGQALHDLDVVLVGDRLGQHGQRADRRLQLVADVGDEVGAHRVEPGPLADVVDRRRSRRPLAAAWP